jgi:hypothetical protein
MKFGLTWKRDILNIIPRYRAFCVDYKRWKKQDRMSLPFNILVELLEKEASHIDNIFQQDFNLLFMNNSRCALLPCITDRPVVNCKDLYDFASLNKKSFYKLCKRYDKRNNCRTAKQWFANTLLQYRFASGYTIKRIELELNMCTNNECPICLETSCTGLVITTCGHTVCTDCFLELVHAKGIRGTMQNIMGYNRYRKKETYKCPVCRTIEPFEIDKYHVYPKKISASFLNAIQH